MRLQLVVPENTLIEPGHLQPAAVGERARPWSSSSRCRSRSASSPTSSRCRSAPAALAFPRLASLGFWLYVDRRRDPLRRASSTRRPRPGFNPLPPLSDTAFISNNGVDVWITAVGLARARLRAAGDQPGRHLCAAARARASPGAGCRPSASRPPSRAGCCSSRARRCWPALTMLVIDRHFDGVFFDPGEGGAPIYYQHLSWIFFTGVLRADACCRRSARSRRSSRPSRGKPLLSRRRGGRLDDRDRRARAARLDAEHVHRLDPDRLALLGDGGGGAAD